MPAGFHVGRQHVGCRCLGDRFHVKDAQFLAVKPHRELRQFRAGLIAVSPDAEDVLTLLGKLNFVSCFRRRSEQQRPFSFQLRIPGLWPKLIAPVPLHEGLGGIHGDRLLRDLLSGGEILFHEHRRQREHVADVVEAEANFVVRKILRLVIDPDQIADGVLVFLAIQPADRHLARIARAGALRLRELAVDVVQHGLALRLGRLRFLLGRHLARFDQLHHLLPNLAVFLELRVLRVGQQIQIALLLFVVVTIEAEFLKHRLDVLPQRHRSSRRLRRRKGGGDRDQKTGYRKLHRWPGTIHAKQPHTPGGIRASGTPAPDHRSS